MIAGHGRLATARKVALRDVPVIALYGLTEIQQRQLMLAAFSVTADFTIQGHYVRSRTRSGPQGPVLHMSAPWHITSVLPAPRPRS